MHSATLSASLALLLLAVLGPALAMPYYPTINTPTRVARDASPPLINFVPGAVRAARPSASPSPSPRPRGEGAFRFRESRVPTRPKLILPRAQEEQELVVSPAEASRQLCPEPMSVCPIASSLAPSKLSEWVRDGYECVDTEEDLTSCGGCGVLDPRYDCTAIEGARSVSCIVGTCRVNTCRPGYSLGLDGSSCVRTE